LTQVQNSLLKLFINIEQELVKSWRCDDLCFWGVDFNF